MLQATTKLKPRKTAPATKRGAATPFLIFAKFRGVCKCGRGFIAGEQIEFDPANRASRCIRCTEKRRSESKDFGQVIQFDSYRGAVQRLKQIANLPRPLEPQVAEEYYKLMSDISTATEASRSVKDYLESSARCCTSGDSERFVVTLVEDKECVHCFEVQRQGELALMEFPARRVHCIWCECTHL
ncbi:MAG: hypothetical protein K2Z81_04150 [Cyanobacteria bacterium]|nr:hypothetical protein [Cyanobacteriota bacterium]